LHAWLTGQTRFPVASCTKLVVTLALATALEQQGHMQGFDTRVIDIVPDFKPSDERATQSVLSETS
jgi:CubicO group peptidase (beta-lactamase class C family)